MYLHLPANAADELFELIEELLAINLRQPTLLYEGQRNMLDEAYHIHQKVTDSGRLLPLAFQGSGPPVNRKYMNKDNTSGASLWK